MVYSHLNGFKMGKIRLYKRGAIIDSRNRIVLPSGLLEELKFTFGDSVAIYADFDKSQIVVKRDTNDK